jgi:hypothetical protein
LAIDSLSPVIRGDPRIKTEPRSHLEQEQLDRLVREARVASRHHLNADRFIGSQEREGRGHLLDFRVGRHSHGGFGNRIDKLEWEDPDQPDIPFDIYLVASVRVARKGDTT